VPSPGKNECFPEAGSEMNPSADLEQTDFVYELLSAR